MYFTCYIKEIFPNFFLTFYSSIFSSIQPSFIFFFFFLSMNKSLYFTCITQIFCIYRKSDSIDRILHNTYEINDILKYLFLKRIDFTL